MQGQTTPPLPLSCCPATPATATDSATSARGAGRPVVSIRCRGRHGEARGHMPARLADPSLAPMRRGPFHAAQRHLQRLQILQHQLEVQDGPLFPSDAGPSWGSTRPYASAAGRSIPRPDETGALTERFAGHCLRVSGQFLSTSVAQI